MLEGPKQGFNFVFDVEYRVTTITIILMNDRRVVVLSSSFQLNWNRACIENLN